MKRLELGQEEKCLDNREPRLWIRLNIRIYCQIIFCIYVLIFYSMFWNTTKIAFQESNFTGVPKETLRVACLWQRGYANVWPIKSNEQFIRNAYQF